MTTLTAGAGASAGAPINTSGSHLLTLFTGSTAYGTATDRSFTLQTAGGLLVSFNGSNFASFETTGLPATGLIESVSIRNGSAVEIAALTHLLVSISNLRQAVINADASALNYMFFAGHDTLGGSDFADTLVARNGNDTVNAGAGDDRVQGDDGDDTLNGDAGNDSVDGGRGRDFITGGLGDDTLEGGEGDDVLTGGDGNDSIAGGTGADLLNGDDGVDTLHGGDAGDFLVGGAGNDVLNGDGGDDLFRDDAGDDTIHGGTGNDRVLAGEGDDTLDGGAGSDTLSFADATSAVVASLAAGTATAAGYGTDTFTGIESLIGGSGDDVLTGSDGAPPPVLPNLFKPATLNNSYYNRLSLDGSFDIEADAHIQNSTVTPHATVYARASSPWYFAEYYSFTTTMAHAAVTIDIDATDAGFDSALTLYRAEANGNLSWLGIQSNDSPALDPGSNSTRDAWISTTLGAPGTYVAVVSANTYAGFYANYTLHVSVEGAIASAVLDGGAGNDTLAGGAGWETLIGGTGADHVDGGDGNDLVIVNPGDLDVGETLAGGAGIDVLRLAGTGAGSSVDLSGHGVGGFEVLDLDLASLTLSAAQVASLAPDLAIVDRHTGEAVTLRITGAAASIDLSGWTLSGWEAWRDTIVIEGSPTATAYVGSGAYEQVSYAGASAGITASLSSGVENTGDAAGDTYVAIDQITGTAHGDALLGHAGVNALYGGAGNDLLYGLDGDDNLQGGDGDDLIEGGAGADFMDGGNGFDTVSYASAAAPIVRYLGSSSTQPGDARGDVLFSIEALSGSAFADILGGGGGNETLSGAYGNDWLLGMHGDDTLNGDAGNDVLVGGAGSDVLDGGAGDDLAWYRDAGAGVEASLTSGGSGGEAAGDSYAAVENLWGSEFGDTLAGDGAANQVYGFGGVDTLDGAGGDDIVYGGDGADTLTGGAGADSFQFLRWQGEGGDTIADFTSGTDRIAVSRFWFGIDTTGPAAALQAGLADFVTSGGAVSALPTFYWNSATGVLGFDPDGQGQTPTFVLATLQPGASLLLSDIWSG